MTMTNQEAFNIACAKLIEQGVPSEDDCCCMYRGPNGTRCAVGWLIPDDKYDPEFEGMNPDQPNAKDLREALPCNDPDFLSELQLCHDWADPENFVQDFKSRAMKLAEKYNLDTSVLD